MDCKDCFHYEICNEFIAADLLQLPCSKFKSKSKIVELPCKVGDTVYEVMYKYKCDMCSENRIKYKGTYNSDYCSNYLKTHNKCPVESKAWIEESKFNFSMFSLFTMQLRHGIYVTKEQAEARLKELQNGN